MLVGITVVEHLDGAAHGVGRDLLAPLGQHDQLGEDALGEGHVGRSTGEGEFVAPHVDVGLEHILGDAQALVARAQQREQCGVRNGHAGLDGIRMGQGVPPAFTPLIGTPPMLPRSAEPDRSIPWTGRVP